MGADRIVEYERAVTRAGGEPVQLPPEPALVERDVRNLDGLVLSGGADVDPARYGAVPHPTTERASAERDAYELALARAAFEHNVPTLAICRGVQVANVAFGGSLHQHVPEIAGEEIPHAPNVNGVTERGLIDAHAVRIATGSQLQRIVGDVIVTGSRHHQSLDRIAEPFIVVAQTADGIVEAIEPRAPHAFWLGVQWHPESTIDLDDGASTALFRALVDAARAR